MHCQKQITMIMETNFDRIRKQGLLLYEYIRGSQLYNTHIEGKSDIDTGGVFIAEPNVMLGLGFDYKPQVSDAKHDNTWYEFNEWVKLLLKSNPNMIESLYVPNDKIIGDVHPFASQILENRDLFISKECFKPLCGYAISQLKKCSGLHKMINKPVYSRLGPLDFCYTFYNQGSTKIQNWLEYRGLNQEHCGLVNIPNMYDMYAVYYDWGSHFNKLNINENNIINGNFDDKTFEFILSHYDLTIDNISTWYDLNKQPKGYRGIVGDDSNELRINLSSIPKGERPICYLSYNANSYKNHYIDYKNYQEWVKNRNPIRYESNLNKSYDSKNVMHLVRLLHMGIEIARGDGVILDRGLAGDREFLLKIRNHEFEYDEIMAYVEEQKNVMDDAVAKSTIREKIDVNTINDIVIDIRKKQLTTFNA